MGAVDEWYHLEVDITRTQFQVSVNGVTQQEPMQYAPMLFFKYGSKLKHETKCVTCYLSNPWDTAANVEVTSLDYHKWNPTWDASYPPIDEEKYFFIGEKKGWIAANSYCEGLGTHWHLASIHNQKEQEAAKAACDTLTGNCWLGSNSCAGGKCSKWTDGSEYSFSKLVADANKNGWDNCMVIQNEGTWNIGECSTPYYSLCSYEGYRDYDPDTDGVQSAFAQWVGWYEGHAFNVFVALSSLVVLVCFITLWVSACGPNGKYEFVTSVDSELDTENDDDKVELINE